MSCRIQRWFLLNLVLLASVCWIHLKYFRYIYQVHPLEDGITKTISNDKDMRNVEGFEEFIRRNKIVPIIRMKKHMRTVTTSNDNNANTESYPLVVRYNHAERLSNGNHIKDSEAYPLEMRYIKESIPKTPEKDLAVKYDDDQKCNGELKEMLIGDNSSKDIEFEADFLRSYLISTNYSVDKAFSKIQNFLKLRINHNYFFHNINFDFTRNPAYRFITLLPQRRKDGSVTVLIELAKWNPDEVPFTHLKQIFFMIYLQELRNPVTQASGFSLIYDLADVGFRYIKFVTPENLYLLMHVSLDAIPAIFVGIHLININYVGNLLVTLTRPFLPAFIEKIFYVHSSVEELHDFFPVSMLPVHCGGTLTEYYMADWIREANKQHNNYPEGGQKNIF